MVSPVGYRNPALLARMVATMDHVSGGRFNFGFGAGQLCIDIAGNDPESYELLVDEVIPLFRNGSKEKSYLYDADSQNVKRDA